MVNLVSCIYFKMRAILILLWKLCPFSLMILRGFSLISLQPCQNSLSLSSVFIHYSSWWCMCAGISRMSTLRRLMLMFTSLKVAAPGKERDDDDVICCFLIGGGLIIMRQKTTFESTLCKRPKMGSY